MLRTSVKIIALIAALSLLTVNDVVASSQGDETRGYRVYQQVLFHYFQGDFENTLLSVALAETHPLEETVAHKIALIKGAASASTGLYQQAQIIFNQLLAKDIEPEVQAKAWFWLAHSAFASGQFDVARQAMFAAQNENLMSLLSAEQQHELLYQFAIVQMQQGKQNWRQISESIPEHSIYRSYLTYNQAMFDGREQNYDPALIALDRVKAALLGQQESRWWPFSSTLSDDALANEKQHLLDKVHLARGLMYLDIQDFDAAQQSFSQIGQDAMDKDLALLSFAQAIYDSGDKHRAMSFWQHLSAGASAQYAYSASFSLARVLDELGDKQQAMKRYVQIENRVERDQASLLQFISQINANPGLQDILNDSTPWPEAFEDVRHQFLTGNNAHLIQSYLALMAQTEELIQMDSRAINMLTLLSERQQQRQQRANMMAHDTVGSQISVLTNRQDALRQVLAASHQSPEVLADESQTRQLQRLTQAMDKHTLLAAHSDLSGEYAKRLQRIKRILQWQLADSQIPRRWQLSSELNKTQILIADAKKQHARLKTLAVSHDDLSLQVQKVEALRQRIADQLKTVIAASVKGKQALIDGLNKTLMARQSLLTQYQYQSKLARLRLQDFAQSEHQAEDASDVISGSQL